MGGATLGNTTIGGTLSVTGASTLSSTLSVSGLSSLSGAASTTRLSIFDTAYFGGTATTTVSQTAVNLPTGGTYQINSANVLSNNTLGAGVLSSSLTSLGTLSSLAVSGLSSLSGAASTTRLSIFDTAYFGGTATTTVSQTAVNLPTGGTYQINSANVLSNNTLGAGVLSSSLTSLGTLSSRCFRSLLSLQRLINPALYLQ